MKIIASSAFSAYLAVAAASSPFQATRLRGNQAQDARILDASCPGPSAICAFEGKAAIKPTSTVSPFTPLDPISPSQWELTCGGIPMYEAGNPAKTEASRAYLNWECSTSTLCILVKANEGFYLHDSEDDMWFKNYSEGSNVQPRLNGMKKTLNNDDQIISWEACYSMVSDCTQDVEIHANYDFIDPPEAPESRTTSTGKDSTGRISLDLTCPCDQTSPTNDCEIDACYANSQCVEKRFTDDSGSSFVCDYHVAYDNCCTKNEDCDDGLECGGLATSTTGTGTCILPPPTVSATTVPPGGEATTAAPPNANQCEVASAASDCDVPTLLTSESAGSAECAAALCLESSDGNSCAVGPNTAAQGESCEVEIVREADNTCYQGNVCNGINCVAKYLSENMSCRGPTTDTTCLEYKCKTPEGETGPRTTCEPVFTEVGTPCNNPGVAYPRGPCDSGDKCDGAGTCSSTDSYQPISFVCNESADLCDAPEYCTGDKYICPEDKNYGDDGVVNGNGDLLSDIGHVEVCRPECSDGSCLDDVAEVCLGGTKKCPDNVIFSKELDIFAAQHYYAGSTQITVTDHGNGVEVCITTKLDNSWELQNPDDSIKMEINDVEAPLSSPGSYSYKDLAKDYYEASGVTTCYPFTGTSSTIYFTLHLDVVDNSGNAETAWPKLPTTEESAAASPTSLTPQAFVKKGTKSGPKVKVASAEEDGPGWGGYFTFSIGCANVDTCDITPTAATTTTTTGTTIAPGSSTTTTAGPFTFTCTGSDSTELTCMHATAEDFSCHNLFE